VSNARFTGLQERAGRPGGAPVAKHHDLGDELVTILAREPEQPGNANERNVEDGQCQGEVSSRYVDGNEKPSRSVATSMDYFVAETKIIWSDAAAKRDSNRARCRREPRQSIVANVVRFAPTRMRTSPAVQEMHPKAIAQSLSRLDLRGREASF
jgi:hypothetical protein